MIVYIYDSSLYALSSVLATASMTAPTSLPRLYHICYKGPLTEWFHRILLLNSLLHLELLIKFRLCSNILV